MDSPSPKRRCITVQPAQVRSPNEMPLHPINKSQRSSLKAWNGNSAKSETGQVDARALSPFVTQHQDGSLDVSHTLPEAKITRDDLENLRPGHGPSPLGDAKENSTTPATSMCIAKNAVSPLEPGSGVEEHHQSSGQGLHGEDSQSLTLETLNATTKPESSWGIEPASTRKGPLIGRPGKQRRHIPPPGFMQHAGHRLDANPGRLKTGLEPSHAVSPNGEAKPPGNRTKNANGSWKLKDGSQQVPKGPTLSNAALCLGIGPLASGHTRLDGFGAIGKTEETGKLPKDAQAVTSRARSPPGFWRTDMPSTQEARVDRELARMASAS